MSVFQLLESTFDGRFLVGRYLVTVVLQEVFGGKYHRIGLVQLVYFLALLLVSVLVCLGFSLHAIDFFLAQSRRCLDANSLFLARSLVLGAYV